MPQNRDTTREKLYEQLEKRGYVHLRFGRFEIDAIKLIRFAISRQSKLLFAIMTRMMKWLLCENDRQFILRVFMVDLPFSSCNIPESIFLVDLTSTFLFLEIVEWVNWATIVSLFLVRSIESYGLDIE